jgi:serine/threonine-protein kinase
VLTEPLKAPSVRRPEVPPELDAIVMGLLERSIEARTVSGAVVRRQLLPLQGDAAPLPGGQAALAELVAKAPAPGVETKSLDSDSQAAMKRAVDAKTSTSQIKTR